MAERDPLLDLHELAHVGEQEARPLPVGEVRALGNRRRRRRHLAAAAGALTAALVTAGAVLAGTGVLQSADSEPPPFAATPQQPSGRALNADNLLRTSDVPRQDLSRERVVQTPDGVGRPAEQSSVCIPDGGLSSLGAAQTLQRNFRYEIDDPDYTPDPADPTFEQPSMYTQAYQFADSDAAERAKDTYGSWLGSCSRLDGGGYERLTKLDVPLTEVDVPNGQAEVAEVVYKRPGETGRDEAYWESVGLTVVDDRLMVTVYLHYATEWYASLKPDEGEFTHPQVGLVEASAARLSS